MSKLDGWMMGGGMAAAGGLMCGAPLLLATGAGSVLWDAVTGAAGWLAGGLALVVVAGVVLLRRRGTAASTEDARPEVRA